MNFCKLNVLILIFFIVPMGAFASESTDNSDYINIVTKYFENSLINEGDFNNLVTNKDFFLPEIIKHEKELYAELFSSYGFEEDIINEDQQRIEDEINKSFNNITEFRNFLDIKPEDSISEILLYPEILEENSSEIQIIYPFLKWSDEMYRHRGKAIIWTFEKSSEGFPILKNVNMDYNSKRTKKMLLKDYGKVLFILDLIRNYEAPQQYFQIQIFIETNAENLEEARRVFEKLKKEVIFPENIDSFYKVIHEDLASSDSESQMGETFYFVLYKDYRKNGSDLGATILPDIEIDILGDVMTFEKPMILCRPMD